MYRTVKSGNTQIKANGNWNFGKTCVVCGSTYVEMHHIYHGTANRKQADKYGYIIPLCREHHTGNNGIHFNKEMDLHWKKTAQIHFEFHYGSREDFINIFGRNYL